MGEESLTTEASPSRALEECNNEEEARLTREKDYQELIRRWSRRPPTMSHAKKV